MKTKKAIVVGVLLLTLVAPPAFGFDFNTLGDIVKGGFSLLKKDKDKEGGDDSSGGLGGLLGEDGIFTTGGFNPNAGSGDDDDDGQSKFNPSYGGIDLDTLTKKDRTKEEDVDLFTKSVDLALDKSIGYDSSKYTSIFGSLLKFLSKKSAKKTGDVLSGEEGQDNLSSGEDGLLSDVGNLLENSEEIIGAIGVLIPDKVGEVTQDSQFLGEGGGPFGVNKVIQSHLMKDLAETEAISQSIDSMFSDEGQAVVARLQASVEETSYQVAEIADQAQGMKASLDVSKALTGQMAGLATNQNATYAESIQNRLATVQGNQLTAKLVKIENQRIWNDNVDQSARLASSFKNASGFASLLSRQSDP